MIRKIIQIGDTRLVTESTDVKFPLSNEDKELIIDLQDTLNGTGDLGAGISAVQIGVNKRIFIACDIDTVSAIKKAKSLEKLSKIKVAEETIGDKPYFINSSLEDIKKHAIAELTYVVINPRLIFENEYETYYWEGCLSVGVGDDALYAPIARSEIVEIEYYNPNGDKVKLRAANYFAHVILHEIDHLEGKLFLSRVTDLSKIWKSGDLDRYFSKHNKYPPFK